MKIYEGKHFKNKLYESILFILANTKISVNLLSIAEIL